jgi:hypothetical protein
MAREYAPQFVTGNDLLDGDVIYLTAQGTWSRYIGAAATATDADAAEVLLALGAAQQHIVVGPYLADAPLADGSLHFRESFRMNGPSTHPHLGKQAKAHV